MNKDKLKYYLEILNLDEYSDLSAIKKGYRSAAKTYHPDKTLNQDAIIDFNEIKTAYDALIKLRTLHPNGSILTVRPPIKKIANTRKKSTKKEKISLNDLLQSQSFWSIILSLLNIFLLIRIGLNTLITPLNLLFIFLTACLSSVFWPQRIKSVVSSFLGHIGLPMLLVNLLLTINFLFSHSPFTEKYFFKEKGISIQNAFVVQRNESTLIELENGKYQEYPGIRIFFDLQELFFKSSVEFSFETGLFGITVLKKSKLK